MNDKKRTDLTHLPESDLKAILYLIDTCAWLPDRKDICDSIRQLKVSAEFEFERRRKEIPE